MNPKMQMKYWVSEISFVLSSCDVLKIMNSYFTYQLMADTDCIDYTVCQTKVQDTDFMTANIHN